MKNIVLILAIISFTCNGCKKLTEVDSPLTSVSSQNVYSNDATAIGVLTSLYVKMVPISSIADPGPISSISCIGGLSADELDYYNLSGVVTLSAYYRNNLTKTNVGNDYWSYIYPEIYVINSAIDGLTVSSGLKPTVKQQLLGEAKFMRAFYYFYLVNLYGDVPLVLKTDYTINSLITKSAREDIYGQVIKDLNDASDLLSENYLSGDCITATEERVRPTKWAAHALLARVDLYLKRWADAEAQATMVLNNSSKFDLTNVNDTFLKNSQESIWQLQPTRNGQNTPDASTFILSDGVPSLNNPVYLNPAFVDSYSDEDKRKNQWIGSVIKNGVTYSYPYKYKVTQSNDPNAAVTEYTTVLRLAELYLIRAESRIHLGNFNGSVEDVDKIRKRAGLGLLKDIDPGISNEDLLQEIQDQRRLELFTEWGHRWFDLKRTGKIDQIMTLVTPRKSNGLPWKSFQQNYPISLNELQANPNLTPTPGY